MMGCAVACGISFRKFLGKFDSTSTKTLKMPLYIMVSASGRGLFLFHFASTFYVLVFEGSGERVCLRVTPLLEVLNG